MIRRAGGPVHLVGHSYGALVCLDLALCGLMPLMSLTLIEPVVFGLLRQAGELSLHEQFTTMRDDYFRSFEAGDREATRHNLDYLDGPGRFASLPADQRAQFITKTPTHAFDMRSGFDPKMVSLRNILLPTRILRGERTSPALHKCADILSGAMVNASLHTICGADHFMTATHSVELAEHVADHVIKAESWAWGDLSFASPFGISARSPT